MATYERACNKLITCPYDDTHRVKESRFQIHVAKCQLNHLSDIKETCPFNAQHRLPKGELYHHLLICPDRAPLDKSLVASTDEAFRGHLGVPSYNSQHIETRENWDVELSSKPSSGYEPHIKPPPRGIRTDVSRMKNAERKKYYKALHHTNDENEESNETVEKTYTLRELRKPTTVSRAQLLSQQKLPVHELQNIGLGRGHPIGSAGSRIAANIYGKQSQQDMPLRQPRSAPGIPGFQIPNLGMGRGRGIFIDSEQDGFAELRHETGVIEVGHKQEERT